MTAKVWIHAVAELAGAKIVWSNGTKGSFYELQLAVPWKDDGDENHAARLRRKMKKLLRAMLEVDAAQNKRREAGAGGGG